MFLALDLVTLTPEETAEFVAGDVLEIRGHPCPADLLPDIVARSALQRQDAGEEWLWCAPRLFFDLGAGRLVGSGCFKNSPFEREVEIGYGVAAAYAGRGYASAGVACLVQQASARDEVAAISAETSLTNRASERVLEKNGFVRGGSRVDSEGEVLTLWRLERSPAPQASSR